MATIVLAEDHPIVREGIRAYLSKTSNHELVAECGDGTTAVELVHQHQPDILILDLRMPGLDGLEVARRVSSGPTKTAVVVLSMFATDTFVSTAFRNGALAYVLKSSDLEDLNEAISSALKGKPFVSKGLARRLIREPFPSDRYELLTAREREIFHLVGEGLSPAEISDRLSISVRTTEKHVSNLMRKLDAKKNADLIRIALQRGMIPLDGGEDRKAC